jgi:hypothetical protein
MFPNGDSIQGDTLAGQTRLREVRVSASSPFLQISDGIRAHILESVGTILVGTRDAALTPEVTRGWGPTILPDGHTMDVCVSLSAGAKTLENLRDCDEVAVTFCHTSTYKAVQLKGRFLESGELTPQDLEAFERQKDIFLEQTKVFGISLSIASRLFTPDLVRLRFVVHEAFEQTPGPGAGAKL